MQVVVMLKDHLHYKKGDEVEVSEERAAYWNRCKVSEPKKEQKPEKIKLKK